MGWCEVCLDKLARIVKTPESWLDQHQWSPWLQIARFEKREVRDPEAHAIETFSFCVCIFIIPDAMVQFWAKWTETLDALVLTLWRATDLAINFLNDIPSGNRILFRNWDIPTQC